jgi:probable HAF family extracellular repeat protein
LSWKWLKLVAWGASLIVAIRGDTPGSPQAVLVYHLGMSRRYRSVVFTLVSIWVPLATGSAEGATFIPLGDLPGGFFHSVGKAVSDDGTVVTGWSRSSEGLEAFRWTDSGGMQGLGDLPGGGSYSAARSISADGSNIVGESESAGPPAVFEAFRWNLSQGMLPLGHLAGGGLDSRARAVSGDGTVVVGRSDSALGTQAFLWTATGGMQGLGDLPGGLFDSRAIGISDDGSTVVGRAESAAGTEAFLWTAPGGMQGLGDLPGGVFLSVAEHVNQDGSVGVGFSESADGTEAFLWTASGGMQGLRDLPGGAFASKAFDVSPDGRVVVGGSESWAGDEAFLWDQENGMRSLQGVLEEEFAVDLTGFELALAHGVSADGTTIVGYALNSLGETEGFVAVLDVGCADGIDNDGDGSVDYPDDPGCTAPDDLLETAPGLSCDDGIDNDDDGRTDFDPLTYANPGDQNTDPAGQGDPVCTSPTFWRENAQCQDGLHNDRDGKMDYDGGRSIYGVAQTAPDPLCVGKPWQNNERPPAKPCGLGAELALLLPPLMWLWRRRGGPCRLRRRCDADQF